jgi:hypothetical protein
VDSTEIAPGETAPGLSADERQPNDNDAAARPETEPGATAGSTAEGEAAEAVDMPAEGETPGDTGDGAPRPRRRRRRRRRPAQAMAGTEAEARSDAFPGEATSSDTHAPAEAGEAPAEAAATGIAVEHDGAEVAAEAGSEGAAEDRPVLRLRIRNRRRRRRPAALGLLPGHSDPVETGSGTTPAIAEIRAALAPGQRSCSVPRRQRRHAPLSGDPAALSSGEAAPRTTGTAAEPARRRRRRRPTDAAAPRAAQEQTAEAGTAAGPEGESSGQRHRRGEPGQAERGEGREGGGRERRAEGRGGNRDRGRGRPGDRGERRDRGGRGAPPKRVIERKLYSVDSIVDRGFEDVEEDGGDTRRVHWTIVKRTTADQISRKPVSTVYVVQREGADTEFPTLGTARSSVNKTIVHPEKLTPSKAERAIAKK